MISSIIVYDVHTKNTILHLSTANYKQEIECFFTQVYVRIESVYQNKKYEYYYPVDKVYIHITYE